MELCTYIQSRSTEMLTETSCRADGGDNNEGMDDGGDAGANVDDDAEGADKDDGSGIEVEGSPASGFGGTGGADGDKPGDEEQGEQAGGFGVDDGDKPDNTCVFSLKDPFLFRSSLPIFHSSWVVLTTNLLPVVKTPMTEINPMMKSLVIVLAA
jgi:hypothetical protein